MKLFSIYNTLSFIWNHPLNSNQKIKSILSFFWWQIYSRFPPYYFIFTYGEKSRLIAKKGMKGATGNIYTKLQDFNEMMFLLHFLDDSMCFIDVGSNIGSYSVLAAVETGSKVYSFEPSKKAFDYQKKNIDINGIQNNVKLFNCGLSSKEEVVSFTKELDTINRVSLQKTKVSTETLKFYSFDSIIQVDTNSLMKIDVEGYESEVLLGMKKALNSKFLKAIIIELNGLGEKYGFSDLEIHELLMKNNFLPYAYNPYERNLSKANIGSSDNIIYIKDLKYVINKVRNKKKYTINNQLI